MDPVSTALTVAWLDAVRRAGSEAEQRYQAQAPRVAPPPAERSLTDVIESALKSAGAKPRPGQAGQLIDMLS